MLEEQESFLCAIYDVPDDPTPRLVYADWLEERGEVAAGQYLRSMTLIRHTHDPAELARLTEDLESLRRKFSSDQLAFGGLTYLSGPPERLFLEAAWLEDLDGFRSRAIAYPKWFVARSVQIRGRRIPDATPFRTLFTAGVTRHVHMLNVAGFTGSPASMAEFSFTTDESGTVDNVIYERRTDPEEYVIHPFFTPRAFSLFINMKATNRLTHLDLRYNNLDNDALRALAKSPHLNRLQRL